MGGAKMSFEIFNATSFKCSQEIIKLSLSWSSVLFLGCIDTFSLDEKVPKKSSQKDRSSRKCQGTPRFLTGQRTAQATASFKLCTIVGHRFYDTKRTYLELRCDKKNHCVLLLALLIPVLVFAQKEVEITPQIVYETHVKQAQVEYHRWWVENLEDSKHIALINLLMDKAESGQLPVTYPSPMGAPCPPSKCKMTLDELRQIMHGPDSIYRNDDYEAGEVDYILEHYIDHHDIVRLEFLEEWKYDHKKEQFVKKVNAVGMMVAVYDEISGELRGYKPLFHIWFNEVEMME